MVDGTRVAAVDEVPENGSYLFTAEDAYSRPTELILVRCDDEPGIEAWPNTCTHENQRFDRGTGAAVRDGEIICPKHGSMFDTCSGACENGEAAGTSLPDVDIAVTDGGVFLTDDEYTYLSAGAAGEDEDGDDGDDDDIPSSTSHIGF
ncbi:Rieske 2Fe-2S domain-containing protein [Haloferax volcanii]|uniref:Rieske 2Fe-2S domain-containing protein n=4 Tax=Haloferax TaxID=2251 RepID=A0A6C0UQC2_HALVO|nr:MULTISPECIES: Rieske 2Fe-2S domain-containing protein [Haloferax]ELK55207.1 rieske [2Fe-2S] domain containing oxidoreductase [Haloferax sp. BAB-2207]ELZ72711.1 rieske [2Fe-2S] domain containing oxidoreductase [Haloferax lucentense DSM 14919]ELZ92217.1 rieske [2Fe-2S] domain containing oxidoreductase [Haloferax alexandrinus JCM 10717]MBC9985700.1 Rieske (2Fe-2S) protein [Haloferax sp. AS1]NLV01850.1 Rieske 2Fe-2S domain-containing protein [Haloferax alexandrinus]